MEEKLRLTEKPRPFVRPTDDVWVYCERLAEEHNITPLEVLKKLVWIGEEVTKIEEQGGKVIGVKGEKTVEIQVFGKNGNGYQTPTP